MTEDTKKTKNWGRMQRNKGSSFELQMKKMFEEALNIFVKRGNQTMGACQPDLATDDYWVECHHAKAPRIMSKIEQAIRDLKHPMNKEHRFKIPLVVFKKNRGEVWVCMPLFHFFQLRGNARKERIIEKAETNVERNLKHYTEETCPVNTKKK